MRRPGLSTLVLDEADLMLSMPGYEEDLQAVAPLVPSSPALPELCKVPASVMHVGSCTYSRKQDRLGEATAGR